MPNVEYWWNTLKKAALISRCPRSSSATYIIIFLLLYVEDSCRGPRKAKTMSKMLEFVFLE